MYGEGHIHRGVSEIIHFAIHQKDVLSSRGRDGAVKEGNRHTPCNGEETPPQPAKRCSMYAVI